MMTHTKVSMIGRIIGNVRIISEIGRGGMGVVYLAEHVTLPRRFAVKSLAQELTHEPHFRDRFYEEAKNQALLDHPNIVQATDLFDTDGQFFLVMEYVDGQNLAELIGSEGILSENEALHIIKDVLNGLDFAHKKGIIHRDIKPSNILVDNEGRARIMDFGIALLAGRERLTQTGVTIGSPWYMSPEQIINPHDIDHRTDVYSAGIVLYEMLTGEVPFDGETDYTVENKQVNSPIPDPRQKNPDIRPELARIIRKAMKKKPPDRFRGCSDFLNAIGEIEIPAPPPLRKWMLSALFTIVLAIVGVIYYLIVFRTPIISSDISEKPIKRQHNTAFNLIETVSEKVLMFCRELELLKNKQEACRIAKEMGETNFVDSLTKQVQDHERNINNAVNRYNDLISELSELKNEIVTVEFDNYAQILTQKSSFEQIPITHAIKRFYQQYRNDNKSGNVEILQEACNNE